MGELIFLDEKELKKANRKAWLREKKDAVMNFVGDNKEIIVPVVGTVGGVGIKLFRSAKRSSNIKKEKHLKECMVYDRSLGRYWELRKPLTRNQALEFDRRKRNGESCASILSSMKVLK